MSFFSKVGSFNLSSTSLNATTAVTGLGFQPVALILWAQLSTTTTDTVGRATIQVSFGFAASPTSRGCVSYASADASASANNNGRTLTTQCLTLHDPSGTENALVDLQSFDSDGFTLINDAAANGTYRIHYLALGGTDITNATVNIFTPGSNASVDITNTGFKPDCVIFTHAENTSPIDQGDAQFCVGFAAGSTPNNACFTTQTDDGSANMDCDRYGFTGDCIAEIPLAGGATLDGRGHVSAWLSNGFTLTFDNIFNITNANIIYLALKGGSYLVGDLLTQTNTTTNITESGFGFDPSSALFISHCTAQSTANTTQTESMMSIGAASSTTARAAIGFRDEDSLGTSECEIIIEHDNVYARVSNAAAIEGLMDMVSFDSGGFTCKMSDADPDQAWVGYLAFGPAAAAPSTFLKDPIMHGMVVPWKR